MVTILAPKIKILGQQPSIDLHVVSSAPEKTDYVSPPPKFISLQITRTIRPFSDLISIWLLFKIIKKGNYDIVHTHTAKAGIVGAVAGFLAGVPVVHTYHGLPFFDGQKRIVYEIYKWLELLSCKLRKVVFSQIQKDIDILKKVASFKIKIIHEGNGVEVDEIEKNIQISKTIENHDNCFLTNNIRLLCVSRLESVKHIEKFIDCVQYLISSGTNVEAIIAGKGGLKDHLQNIVYEKELSHSVKIIYTPHIHYLISQADVVMLTSLKEGIPRSIMEAMALKKPVIATDVSGTNELVVHEKTGFLVPFTNQSELNESTLKLIKNESLRKKFGEAGYTRVKENFTEKHVVEIWLKAYKEILNRND